MNIDTVIEPNQIISITVAAGAKVVLNHGAKILIEEFNDGEGWVKIYESLASAAGVVLVATNVAWHVKNFGETGINFSLTETVGTASSQNIAEPLKVIVIGDSMSSDAQSAQYPPFELGHSWPQKLKLVLPNTTVVENGVPSRTVLTMISNYSSVVAPHLADASNSWLVVQGGWNDHNAGASAAVIADRLRQLCALARADGFKVCVWTLHAPDQEAYGSPGSAAVKTRTERIRAVNRILLLNPAWYDAIYRYDLAFDRSEDRDINGRPFNAGRWFTDGLHPSTAASARNAELVGALLTGKYDGIWLRKTAPFESQLNRFSEFARDWAEGLRFVPTTCVGPLDLIYYWDSYMAKHDVLTLAASSDHTAEINARTFGADNRVLASNNTTFAKLARVASTNVQVFKAGNTGGGYTGLTFNATANTPWVWGMIAFGYGNQKVFGDATASAPAFHYTSGQHVFQHASGTQVVSPVIASNAMAALAVRLDGANSAVYFYDGVTFTKTAFSTTSVTPAVLGLGNANVGDAGKLHQAAFISCESANISDADLEKWMRNLNRYGSGVCTSY